MQTSWVLVILALAVGGMYGLLVWQRQWVYKSHEFLGEVKAELKKVSWPSRREVLATTAVVLVTVFFFGVFLSVIDSVVAAARNHLFTAVLGS